MRLESRSGSGSEPPRVSVVVPAFNEERRLATSLPLLRDAWDWGDGAELIIVDDGSTDRTLEIARTGLADVPGARVIHQRHAGKGAAVRRGILAARGERIAFMDADLATDLADLPVLLAALDDADVVVGSRLLAQASMSGVSFRRGMLRQAFSWHARRWAGVGVSDPQCGFKAFRRPAARAIFKQTSVAGFGFDVEVLLLAQRHGFSVVEIPVRWQAIGGSRVRIVRDSPRMLADVLRLRLRRPPAPEAPPLTELEA